MARKHVTLFSQVLEKVMVFRLGILFDLRHSCFTRPSKCPEITERFTATIIGPLR